MSDASCAGELVEEQESEGTQRHPGAVLARQRLDSEGNVELSWSLPNYVAFVENIRHAWVEPCSAIYPKVLVLLELECRLNVKLHDAIMAPMRNCHYERFAASPSK